MSPTGQRVHFPGAAGARLAGRLELPVGEPAGCALFAHCFTCSKDLKATARISRALAERGFLVLRFDFTGLGESEGDFGDTNFSSNLDDLVAAAGFMKSELTGAPQVLIGHSLGGAAVLAAAGRLPAARAFVTIGAPSDTTHLRDSLLAQAPDLAGPEGAEETEVRLAGRSFRIQRQFIEDLEQSRMEEAIGALGRPLLIFHSPTDEIVDIDHARRIYKAARHPKSFVSLDGADHLLLARQADSRFVAEVLAAWASRYLDPPAMDAGAEAPPEGVVEARGGPSGFATEIVAGRHRLRADEPARVGGADTGPTPYDLLLAGLGACKAMTVRMYADRKKWPLTGSRVRLEHDRIHAEDCAACETESGLVDRIRVAVGFDGELSDEQVARLHEIAGRCPVHRTLENEIVIESELD